MECGTCRKDFSDTLVVPVTCRCGKTVCRDCVQAQTQRDSFTCQSCKKTLFLKDLIINRAISDIAAIIKVTENTKTSQDVRKKVFVSEQESFDYSNSSGFTKYLVNREVEAVVHLGSQKVQTIRSYLISEKFSNLKLPVKISWKHCFLVPVYFLIQLPWIFVAVFTEKSGNVQETYYLFRRWVGLWLLNFCIFSILNVANSETIADFSLYKLKYCKSIALMANIFTETIIIIYGWLLFSESLSISPITDPSKSSSNSDNFHFTPSLGMTITGSLFNTFLITLTGFLFFTGHPLIHIPFNVNSQKFSYKKSLSLKIFLLIFLFAVPDILLYQSKFNLHENKLYLLLSFYTQVVSISIFLICSNNRRHMSVSSTIIIVFHMILSLFGLICLEGNFTILHIYNGFADSMCLLIFLIGKKEVFESLFNKKTSSYKRL